MTTSPAPEIRLHCHAVATGGFYTVVFDGTDPEPAAIAFYESHTATHSIVELEDAPIDARYGTLLELLHPTCEHGLSASLCAGLGHYPGPLNSDDPMWR